MKQYHNPRCNAPDDEDPRGICGVPMQMRGERHPMWKAKHWVFECPRCEAVRLITEDQLYRNAEVR